LLRDIARQYYFICCSVFVLFIFLFFFFSSRRRHTRLQGDWSSDVCSSDLPSTPVDPTDRAAGGGRCAARPIPRPTPRPRGRSRPCRTAWSRSFEALPQPVPLLCSEAPEQVAYGAPPARRMSAGLGELLQNGVTDEHRRAEQ